MIDSCSFQWNEQVKGRWNEEEPKKKKKQFPVSHSHRQHHSGFKPSCTALGDVLNRSRVTGREPFYLTAGSRSDTREKQQEGSTDQGHMRPGCLWGTRYRAQPGFMDRTGDMQEKRRKKKTTVGRMRWNEESREHESQNRWRACRGAERRGNLHTHLIWGKVPTMSASCSDVFHRPLECVQCAHTRTHTVSIRIAGCRSTGAMLEEVWLFMRFDKTRPTGHWSQINSLWPIAWNYIRLVLHYLRAMTEEDCR